MNANAINVNFARGWNPVEQDGSAWSSEPTSSIVIQPTENHPVQKVISIFLSLHAVSQLTDAFGAVSCRINFPKERSKTIDITNSSRVVVLEAIDISRVATIEFVIERVYDFSLDPGTPESRCLGIRLKAIYVGESITQGSEQRLEQVESFLRSDSNEHSQFNVVNSEKFWNSLSLIRQVQGLRAKHKTMPISGHLRVAVSSRILPSGRDFSFQSGPYQLIEVTSINLESLLVDQSTCKHDILIIGNNDVSYYIANNLWRQIYLELLSDILVIAWDYDNHHWHAISNILATYSDFYFVAHDQNKVTLESIAGKQVPVFSCASSQFSPSIIESLAADCSGKRSDQPLGYHNFYRPFIARNSIVTAFSRFYDSVGFSASNYMLQSEKDRLDQWTSYKVSLIVPVHGDIPIRLFDSLITGSIPLVPYYLVSSLEGIGIPCNYFSTYSLDDLESPQECIKNAVSLFDTQGEAGTILRIRYAQDFHTIDVRLSDMITYAFKAFIS